jgi:predicted dehydrogenase
MHSRDYFGTKGNLHTREHISGLGQKEMYLQPRARGDHEPWEALRISSKDRKYPDAHGGILEKGFADQILKQKYDYSNLDDAIEALKIIEAAEKSHKTGKAVEL